MGDRDGGPTVTAGSPPTPITQETSTRVTMVSFTTDSDPQPGSSGNPEPPRPAVSSASTSIPLPASRLSCHSPTAIGGQPRFAIDDPVRGRLLWRTGQ